MKVHIVKYFDEGGDHSWSIKVFKSEVKAEAFRKACEDSLPEEEKGWTMYLIQECEADLNE